MNLFLKPNKQKIFLFEENLFLNHTGEKSFAPTFRYKKSFLSYKSSPMTKFQKSPSQKEKIIFNLDSSLTAKYMETNGVVPKW